MAALRFVVFDIPFVLGADLRDLPWQESRARRLSPRCGVRTSGRRKARGSRIRPHGRAPLGAIALGRSPDGPIGRHPRTVRDPGGEDTDQPCSGRHRAVGEGQAALLIGFVTAITGLLLALDVGLHRVKRPPEESTSRGATAVLRN
jgi:hypothetical protein